MESWSYISGVKNFVSDESVSESNGTAKINNGMAVWGLNPSRNFVIGSNSVLCSGQGGTKSHQELEMMKNSVANGSIRDVMSGQFGFGGRVQSHFQDTLSSASGEEESSSKLSSSIVESNSRDLSLIDLKLGRFPDPKDVQTKTNINFSQAKSSSSLPAKKARAASLSTQRPFCQVHGCRKDLSSSKDYHKRHKVCEIHSKTTKVIVKGIEQRFCQQCSRFHLLAEFDDGKRSCRKRLAGHNERRRKPHIGIHTGRAGRGLHSHNGTRLERSSSVLSSFVCQDILPGSASVFHPQKYEMNDWCKTLKVDDGSDYGHEPAIPNSKGQRHSRPNPSSSFGSDKPCDLRNNDGLNAMTGGGAKMNQKFNPFLQNVPTSDFDSYPVFHNTTIVGSEDLTGLDSSSVVQGLTATSSYGCALSLLSSQSQSSSIYSSGVPTGVPLIAAPSCNAHYSIKQVAEKLMRVSPQTSTTTGVSSSFPSSAETQIEPILISDGSDSANYGISGIIPGSEFMNAKNQLSCGDGSSTIDLLQLSTQLERVEHQRRSMKAKEDNDAPFGLRIT